MKVQFLKLVVNVWHVWEVKEVSDPYARNFLIPKWLAKMLTLQDEKALENKRKKEEQQRVYKLENRNELFEKLNNQEFQFHLNATQSGKTFGSVWEKEIIDELGELKLHFTKSDITLPRGHIKKPWKYDAFVKLWGGKSAKLIILVK